MMLELKTCIVSEQQLIALYGKPNELTLKKELTCLEKHSIKFLQLSPICVVSTYNKKGKVDSSPRGGVPGFAKVLNNRQIAIADAKGNNRLDSLINIVETGEIGCLFMIPGIDETLRVNGSAHISVDSDHLMISSGDQYPPKSVIIIDVEKVFVHCAKSMIRSKLWHSEAMQERTVLPSIECMIEDQVSNQVIYKK
jgi:PPOX class probable FMN-dependent enzyme